MPAAHILSVGVKDMRKRKHILLRLAVIVTLFACCAVYILSAQIRPVLFSFAETKVSDLVERTVNEIISERLGDGSIEYKDIVTLEKGTDGRITAIITNMAAANRLRAELTNDIIARLGDRDTNEMKIPLGNFLNSALFTGVGPKISVRILSVTSVEASFTNRFTSAGINQTRHEIMLNIDTYLTVLVPMSRRKVHIPTQVCVAETVIVGEVPEYYSDGGRQ